MNYDNNFVTIIPKYTQIPGDTGRVAGGITRIILHNTAYTEFPKPGEIEVVLRIAHEESTLFPKFKLHIQSPIEAIYHGVSLAPKGSNQAAILSSVLAYLMNSKDELKDKEMRSCADVILCNLLQKMPDIPHIDWRLSTLLCGKIHGFTPSHIFTYFLDEVDGILHANILD